MNAPLPLKVAQLEAGRAYDRVAGTSNEVAGLLASRLASQTQGEVLFSPADRGRYATDASIYQAMPVGVFVPRSSDDVKLALDICRDLKVPIIPQAWIAGHRVDFLIGDRLVLQIDGGHHVGAQREADIEHDAALMLLGYHVVRVDYRQIIDRWHTVQDMIARAVAQGLHLAH